MLHMPSSLNGENVPKGRIYLPTILDGTVRLCGPVCFCTRAHVQQT